MVKPKKDLQASSAIWRSAIEEDEDEDDSNQGNLFATTNDSNLFTMSLHDDNSKRMKTIFEEQYKDSPMPEIDSQLNYTFRRNYQFLQNVFSIDTLVKPLPPAMAENVSRNLTFFRRIFTQFSEPDGIYNAQKSLGLGREDKFHEVR